MKGVEKKKQEGSNLKIKSKGESRDEWQ